MNRKGVMYTVVSVILLLVIGVLFFGQTSRKLQDEHATAEDRVRSVNGFIKSLSSDSQRAARIAGFRTLIAMEQHVTTTGDFIDDPPATFREIFLTGNLSSTNFLIMDNSSFNEYLGKVKDDAANQGIAFNATVTDVTLWQVEPWAMLVNYTLEMNVTDARGTASWSTTRTFTGRVPITDLRDPLFTAHTLGRIQRVVKMSNVTVFVNDAGDANDTSGLMYHFNNSLYIARGRGPSMLMRFAGNISDSPYGIESLVDTEELSAQDLAVNSTKSVVDYLYFNGTDATACNIQNVPARLKLAARDLDIYQVEGKLTYGSC